MNHIRPLQPTLATAPCLPSVARLLQRGFTIVEMMVVLIVAGVLIAGAVYGYQLVFTSKAQNEMKYLDQAMECARGVYSNQATFNGAAISVLVNNNCFPAPLVVNKGQATASVNSSFGSAIAVTAVNLYGTNDGLEFSIPAIPSDICVNMLRLMSKAARIRVQSQAGGQDVIVMALGAAVPDLALATACGNATTATIRAAITKS